MRSGRFHRRALLHAALLLIALQGLAGCKEKKQSRCPRYEQVRRVPAPTGDPVVARVNGRAITASAVKRRAEREGLDKRTALQQVIDDELLVQEAERRGLHKDPAVVEAGKQAAVYQLLRSTFEKSYTPASVPDVELRRIYNRESRRFFNRPELRRFGHAYYTRPWFKRGRRWYIDIEKDRELKRYIQNFQRLVTEKAPKSWAEFKALAERFDQGDQSLATGNALQAHSDLRKSFADALFALPGPGSISEVIETRPWYHVAYLMEIQPKKNIAFAQAKEQIREKLFPHLRKRAFKQWVTEVKRQCRIRVKPEHLPVSAAPGAPAGGR